MFANINKRMILPLNIRDKPFAAMNQLLEADIVYVRDFTRPDSMSPDQLQHLAMIAHHCYASFDLAAKCVQQLALRGLVGGADPLGQYLKIVTASAAPAA